MALIVQKYGGTSVADCNRIEHVASKVAATRGQATLLITHDLDGLDQVDEIIVLDSGAAVERGSHAQLLSSGGWYARMWRAQMPAYTPVCAASLPDFTAAENAL